MCLCTHLRTPTHLTHFIVKWLVCANAPMHTVSDAITVQNAGGSFLSIFELFAIFLFYMLRRPGFAACKLAPVLNPLLFLQRPNAAREGRYLGSM